MLHLECSQVERVTASGSHTVPCGKNGAGRADQFIALAQSPPARAPLALARHCGRGGCFADRALGEMLIWSVAAAFAVRTGEIKARTRGNARAAFARQAAMYLAHVGLGLTYSGVGRLFGRDRTTAAHACRLMEDCRDDPLIDAMLGALESVCYRLQQRAHGQHGRRS